MWKPTISARHLLISLSENNSGGDTPTYGLYADQQRNAFSWNITLELRKRNVHVLFFNDFETRSIYSILSLITFDPALVQNYAPFVVHWSY